MTPDTTSRPSEPRPSDPHPVSRCGELPCPAIAKSISDMLMAEIPKQPNFSEMRELMDLNHWLMEQYGEFSERGFTEFDAGSDGRSLVS